MNSLQKAAVQQKLFALHRQKTLKKNTTLSLK